MMSEILSRTAAPFLVALMWLGAAILVFRPGDSPGGPVSAGILGGLALIVAALAPHTANPRLRRTRIDGKRVTFAGLTLLAVAAFAAPALGISGDFRLLSTPSGFLAPSAIVLAALDSGLALVVAGLIGQAVTHLTAKRTRP